MGPVTAAKVPAHSGLDFRCQALKFFLMTIYLGISHSGQIFWKIVQKITSLLQRIKSTFFEKFTPLFQPLCCVMLVLRHLWPLATGDDLVSRNNYDHQRALIDKLTN